MIAYEKHAKLLAKIMPAIVADIKANEVPKLEIDDPENDLNVCWIVSSNVDDYCNELTDAIYYALVKADAMNQ